MIKVTVISLTDENEYIVKENVSGDCLGAISKNKNGSYTAYNNGKKVGNAQTLHVATLLTLSDFVEVEFK